MLQIDPAALIKTLNKHCTRTLEGAAGVCVSRGHYEVTVEHWLHLLADDANCDVQQILRHYAIDVGALQKALVRHLERQRSGNTGRPVFSPLLLNLIQDSWLYASAELRQATVRSGALLTMLHLTPHSYTTGEYVSQLTAIPRDELRRDLLSITGHSQENEGAAARTAGASSTAAAPSGPHARGADTALGKFTIDFTAQARAEKLDPVIGREQEIRQCIDVLARRRKNNPIIVGEAGVGKTALVEGIAQRIIAKDVPASLHNVELLGLDLGLLQAGAGMKGEFENRLKSVIEEVQASPTPIILFIDEAHTLIGAGGAAGGSDAANLLKPALARGELRTLAATTWSEYKKYFEKDPALTRRFQLIKVDEPGQENAIAMMRGIAPHYERSHGVRILDHAVAAAVELSSRYISGRQLPDKAVDLLDTCAARVSIARDAKPPALQDLERRSELLTQEKNSLRREDAEGYPVSAERLSNLDKELKDIEAQRSTLESKWKAERAAAMEVVSLRKQLFAPPADAVAEEEKTSPGTKAKRTTKGNGSSAPDGELKKKLAQAQTELEKLQGESPLIPIDVTPSLVAGVVADWTGIPVGKMVEDQAKTLIEFEKRVADRIKGQDYALTLIGETIRAAKLGLGNPQAPLGVFLMVGPSGVGKTETALSIADLLFGGERFVVTINMSEFQEKHTVSRLVGSPPGYVGYGEGGVLTEAVRQRPYSAVILDEVEKADPEVMNIFYQVFDKGMLSDGEGRVIDFKNTVIMMTSNLASDIMTQLCMQPKPPTRQQVLDAIHPKLSAHFKPALLARMKVVPYFPLSATSLRSIVGLKLDKLKDRVHASHQIQFAIADSVVDQIANRCTEVESGARNIDHILSRTLLPLVSRALLEQMTRGPLPAKASLDVDKSGEYQLSFG